MKNCYIMLTSIILFGCAGLSSDNSEKRNTSAKLSKTETNQQDVKKTSLTKITAQNRPTKKTEPLPTVTALRDLLLKHGKIKNSTSNEDMLKINSLDFYSTLSKDDLRLLPLLPKLTRISIFQIKKITEDVSYIIALADGLPSLKLLILPSRGGRPWSQRQEKKLRKAMPGSQMWNGGRVIIMLE